ncbi:DUF3549 family protein [Corallincola holothuriorum]|uniref:DUF3549 family protein n=1 Tax=Corallincola holothuriorum TaxID=2282215 RepID=A0A368NHH7_9GAMM|nr:DUF3549 family protein [Corallincola holothuriorum]RCU48859.1 DUF3549 family protein [Corallincola holothuriorum]
MMNAELDLCCKQLGLNLTVYNLGRRVELLDQTLFTQLQLQEVPYPFPLQRHAILAMVIETALAPFEPSFWCLKLPLDEQGMLDFSALNQLCALIQQAFNHAVAVEQRESMLKSNPFAYAPSQQQLALITAHIRAQKQQAASKYYEQAADYFSGQLPYSQWQSLPLQGVADFIIRMEQQCDSASSIADYQALPIEVKAGLAAMAEQVGISDTLAKAVTLHLEKSSDIAEQLCATRMLLHPKHQAILSPMLPKLLSSELGDNAEFLILVAGRGWELLIDPNLSLFLEKTAKRQDQVLFNTLLLDLFAIPGMRGKLQNAFRSSDRSPALAGAIGNFLASLR